MNWNEITTLEEWDEIISKSSERGQVILKHSTTCPVSSNALHEFEQYLKDTPNRAEDLNVKHESPQIIYMKDKAKYWTASHWSVTKAHITAVLD
jgi:hypothetical protein